MAGLGQQPFSSFTITAIKICSIVSSNEKLTFGLQQHGAKETQCGVILAFP